MKSIDTKVGVLDKAMLILQAFPHGDAALSPLEIAAHTGLPLPTVYRLSQALTEHGFLMKEGQSFRLGMELLRLGALVAEGIDVRSRALPHLKWLREQTGENAELHIRYEETRIAVEVARSPHNLRSFVDIGAPLPLHMGAGGKVLLAWLAPEEQETLIAASIARFGNEKPFDVSRLRVQLAEIHSNGWAVSEGERDPDIYAIAAPIFDVKGQMAGALVLAAPSLRLGAKECDRFTPLVCTAARRTSRDLGYNDSQHQLTIEAKPMRGLAKDGQ